MKKKIRRRRCKNCDDLFKPDSRNLKRQKFCRKPECKTGDMRSIKNNFIKFFSKNYLNFSLHDHKTGDINPIVRIDVLADSQRHYSTTFYQ
jgi:hypothetical protein